MDDAMRNALIAKIKDLPHNLRRLVQNLSDQQLDTPYREGGWTVRQVVHHLADSHMAAFQRFRLTLTEDRPTLQAYLQDKWAELPDARTFPIAATLTLLDELHNRWAWLLEHLSASDWRREAIQQKRGVMTAEHLLQLYAEHCDKHLGHINGLLTKRNWKK